MRIDEVISARVLATKEFAKDYEREFKSDKSIRSEIKDFIRHILSSSELFGSKDEPLKGKLKGYYKWHLRHGRLVVIYKLQNNNLILAALDDHKVIDGGGAREANLSKRLDNIAPETLLPFGFDEVTPSLTPEAKKVVTSFLYDLLRTERLVLEKAVAGDLVELSIYLECLEGQPTIDMLDASYPGGLNETIRRMLRGG
jgi:addiction module RelE/StbE family toxin